MIFFLTLILQKAGPNVVDTVALTLESAFSGRPYMVL